LKKVKKQNIYCIWILMIYEYKYIYIFILFPVNIFKYIFYTTGIIIIYKIDD